MSLQALSELAYSIGFALETDREVCCSAFGLHIAGSIRVLSLPKDIVCCEFNTHQCIRDIQVVTALRVIDPSHRLVRQPLEELQHGLQA